MRLNWQVDAGTLRMDLSFAPRIGDRPERCMSSDAVTDLNSAATVTQLRPALVRFFRRRCPTLAEAEDLAHEVIVRALQHAQWTSNEQAKNYIFRAAINLWRDRLRRNAVRGGAEVDWDDESTLEVSEGTTLDRILVSEEELYRVHAALLELGERTRDVFVLHRLEHLKYTEIAGMLGVSVSAVEKHMSKALAHLARRIDDHEFI